MIDTALFEDIDIDSSRVVNIWNAPRPQILTVSRGVAQLDQLELCFSRHWLVLINIIDSIRTSTDVKVWVYMETTHVSSKVWV